MSAPRAAKRVPARAAGAKARPAPAAEDRFAEEPRPRADVLRIRPQPGPQEAFLSSDADIAVYGGAAFAGKTFALLLEPTRHSENPLFRAVIFRRETPQIKNPGGMWDESMSLYPRLGSQPTPSVLLHTFASGAQVKFAHLEHRDTVYDWDGAQVPFIGFDQLEHFEGFQFFYMLSRNRSASGVRPYIRATCNPDPDSFLAGFLVWWIDQDTGFPVKDRAGVKRWMLREGDEIRWFGSRAEALASTDDAEADPKSVAFFPGTIYDNKIGMANDPAYMGNLKAMQRVERERLLGGNWKIRPSAGLMFRREWCGVVPAAPADTLWVRYWDLAATEPSTTNPDPDWTVGVRLGRSESLGKYVLGGAIRMRESPGEVRRLAHNAASDDGPDCRLGFPQDPGQAGKDQAQQLVRHFDGYNVSTRIESGDKVVRFSPFSAQCEAGNVVRLRDLPEDFLRGLEGFPDGKHKDDADACSGAYAMFQDGRSMGLYQYMKQKYEDSQAGVAARAAPATLAEALSREPAGSPGPGGRRVQDLGSAPGTAHPAAELMRAFPIQR